MQAALRHRAGLDVTLASIPGAGLALPVGLRGWTPMRDGNVHEILRWCGEFSAIVMNFLHNDIDMMVWLTQIPLTGYGNNEAVEEYHVTATLLALTHLLTTRAVPVNVATRTGSFATSPSPRRRAGKASRRPQSQPGQ